MSESAQSVGRTGRPPRTSRAEILTAARRIIDSEGWERLTIRRLAGELGVGATTLYHHVRDREELLILLLNQHADETLRAPLHGSARERIVAAADLMHTSLASWPWAAEVLTTDGFVRRLGDSAHALIEVMVKGAVDEGCTPEEAVDLFREIWYLTVGEILVRAHSDPQGTDPRAGVSEPFFGDLDAAQFPTLAAIGDSWPDLAAHDTYRAAVADLVDGRLSRHTRP